MREVDTLITNLRSPKWEVALKAAKELRKFHEPEVVQALIASVTQEKDLWVAIESAKALAEFADPVSVDALKQVLSSTSLEVEMKQTANEPWLTKDFRGVTALIEHHGGEIIDLKMYAAMALLRIGTPEALKSIEEARKSEGPGHLNNMAIDKAVKNISRK